MLIATFNAASIRARLPILTDWLERVQPDVLAVQETKVPDDKFPFEDFEAIGYHASVHGQKSYNGVAFLSKQPPLGTASGFGDPVMPEDCRILAGQFGDFKIINTYVPNGSAVGSEKFEYKLAWLKRFRRFLNERFKPDDKVIWLGDINIAPKPEDVYDSKAVLGGVGHHPDEFAALDIILEWGLTDLFRLKDQRPDQFTFWEFFVRNAVEKNVGWRIDHIYGTASVCPLVEEVWVDREPRLMERPSDHTFVLVRLAD